MVEAASNACAAQGSESPASRLGLFTRRSLRSRRLSALPGSRVWVCPAFPPCLQLPVVCKYSPPAARGFVRGHGVMCGYRELLTRKSRCCCLTQRGVCVTGVRAFRIRPGTYGTLTGRLRVVDPESAIQLTAGTQLQIEFWRFV